LLKNCFIYTASGFQDHLGDVVYVELPEVGVSVSQGKNFGAVESVKATSDINSPVSGEVVEVNRKLSEEPGLVSAAAHTSQDSSEK
jgi:glycine cleavage system H protein